MSDRVAIELLAAHTRAKGAARIAFNMALLEMEVARQKLAGFGMPDVVRKSIARSRRLLSVIGELQDYCADAENSEQESEGEDEDRFYRDLNDALVPSLEALHHRLLEEVAAGEKFLQNAKLAKRGKSPLHFRLDGLADLWGEHGGVVGAGDPFFCEFLSAGSADLAPGPVQMKTAIRSAVSRFNARHGIRRGRGRPKIAKEAGSAG